jgi:hypothetical protein
MGEEKTSKPTYTDIKKERFSKEQLAKQEVG